MITQRISISSTQELLVDDAGVCFIKDMEYKEVLIYDLPNLIRKLVEIHNLNSPHSENHLILLNND